MPRIFLSSDLNPGSDMVITGEKAHYLSAVLRSKKGDCVIITDDRGRSFRSRILDIDRKSVKIEILAEENIDRESGLDITLVQGLLKSDKMDFVIQKATELGVKQIIPLRTERSQTKETRKLPRWKKIAEEAAKQSGRHIIPDIAEPMDFDAFFSQGLKAVPGIIFWEESTKSLSAILGKGFAEKKIVLVTGPEGGFSSSEIDMATDNGLEVASLGRRILRAETAAITVVSIVQYVLGDLGV